MIFLCIAALWILGLASVAGLCIAASRGDSIQARTEPSVDAVSYTHLDVYKRQPRAR